jgi:hypothetical protein
MLSPSSIYDGCRNRLEKDNFGALLWAYLCVALFVIAIAVSMLGCSGIALRPAQEGAQMGGRSDLASAALGFPGGVDSMDGRFSSGALLGLQIQNEQIRPYFGGN